MDEMQESNCRPPWLLTMMPWQPGVDGEQEEHSAYSTVKLKLPARRQQPQPLDTLPGPLVVPHLHLFKFLLAPFQAHSRVT